MFAEKKKVLTYAAAVVAAGVVFAAGQARGDATEKASAAELALPSAYFDLPAQNLADALRAVSRQTNINILINPTLIGDRQAPALKAQLTVSQALAQLLHGTGLVPRFVDDKTVVLAVSGPVKSSNSTAENGAAVLLARVDTDKGGQGTKETTPEAGASESTKGIPEILVQGSKILNMDVQRTRDDPQPFVVFERTTLERSGAASIADFLKQRLPMNSVSGTNDQVSNAQGNISQVNLRGLGTNQTLILVDGRRLPYSTNGDGFLQPDLNGIPLSAVERIEILPATASGIYGGGATGGVVNIILRRDYAGAEVKVIYEDTFDARAARRQVDFSSGFNLEQGKTNVLLSGSYSDADSLLVRDRDFLQNARATILRNNPGFFYDAASPLPGATGNIRSLSGAPLFGPGTSNITSIPVGYAGGGGLAPLQQRAGSYNIELPDNASSAGGLRRGLSNAPTIKSVNLTLRRPLLPRLQGFIDMSAASNGQRFPTNWNPGGTTFTINATAPNNPFGQAIRVSIPSTANDGALDSRNDRERLVLGLIGSLGRGWETELDGTWDSSELSFTLAPTLVADAATAIASGSIDILRDINLYPVNLTQYAGPPLDYLVKPVRTSVRHFTLRGAGPLFDAPGGAVRMTTAAEHRDEDLLGGISRNAVYPAKSQTVNSLYTEFRVPLISGSNELEVQLAGRYDEYTVRAGARPYSIGTTPPEVSNVNKRSAINPTLAVRYVPITDLMLRASYGTGFLPPAPNQLTANAPGTVSVTDPLRGNASVIVPAVAGGNVDLRPEESKSWSAGAVLTPRFVEGLRLSIDYTKIEKRDAISSVSAQQVLDNESIFPGRVVRGPAGGGFSVGPIVSVDNTLVNLSRANIEAYDVALDYGLHITGVGQFDFYAIATWQTHYETQFVSTQPMVENVGVTNSFPLKFKGNAGLTWARESWSAGWAMRYFDSYLVANPASVSSIPTFLNQNGSSVPSQQYHDVFVNYAVPGSARWLAGVQLQLGAKNVFNTKPPFDASANDFYSRYGDARLGTYYFNVKAAF